MLVHNDKFFFLSFFFSFFKVISHFHPNIDTVDLCVNILFPLLSSLSHTGAKLVCAGKCQVESGRAGLTGGSRAGRG